MKRILLDESTPRPIARTLREEGFEVQNFTRSWKGLSDGALLRAMEAAGLQVLLTCDMNMPYQQNLSGRTVGLVVLSSNKQADLFADMGAIVDALRKSQPGRVVQVKIASIRRPR